MDSTQQAGAAAGRWAIGHRHELFNFSALDGMTVTAMSRAEHPSTGGAFPFDAQDHLLILEP